MAQGRIGRLLGKNLPWANAIVGGFIAILLGTLIILSAAGVIPDSGSGHKYPRWVVSAMGSAFLLAGLMALVQGVTGSMPSASETARPPTRGFLLTQLLLGLPLLICFAAAPNWIAFGPGSRAGTASIGVIGVSMPLKTGETAARAVWVVPALGLDAFTVAFLVITLRRLRSARSEE